MKATFRLISTRLTLVTVSFTLLATLILVAASMAQLQSVARANLLQSIEFNLHLVSELVQGDIVLLDRIRLSANIHPETTNYLLDDSDDPRLIRQLHDRLSEDIRQNLIAYRYLRRLVVTDSMLTRRVQVGFVASGYPLMPDNLHLLGDFSERAHVHWEGIKSDPLDMVQREPVLYKISPVFHDGQIIGYLYLSISADVLLMRLSGYRILDQGGLYIQVGGLGYKIDNDEFTENPLVFKDAQPSGDTALNAGTEILSFRSPQGRRYLAVSTPLGQAGIVLTQTIPEGLIMQEAFFVVRLLLLVCLGVILMGALVAFYLSRIISKPVGQINKQVIAISGGDFEINPQIEWDNEFGEIGRGINKLARDVNALIQTRLEDEKRKSALEYKMLQSQINPHFLYNSLNSIKWMATIQNATGIAEITVSLSRLLKSISKINRTVVPLSQELSLLEDYFVISRVRYGDSLTTQINVPENLQNCEIPVFTLQPIVENAIFHGIEANGGVGMVKVSARMVGDMIEISIEDDGIGMDNDTIRKILYSEADDSKNLFSKIGIQNVGARIRHEFGPGYGISIESSQGEYTRVIVRLPFRKEET